MSIKNVIIAGAGGNIGPAICTALDEDPAFNLSVLSRRGSKSTFAPHIRVIPVDGSYPEGELVGAFKGQDAVICVLNPNLVDATKAAINAAVKAGVKRFIPSEFGSETIDPKMQALVPIFAKKREIVEYLMSKEKDGLTWTAVTNGGFFDWGISTGFLGFDLATQTATFYDDGTTPSHMSNLSTVGHAITSALKNLPDQTTNKYIFISDFMPTQRDILAALEKATAGGVKWRITSRRSVAETKKEGEDKLGRGDWSGLGDMIVAAQYVGDVPEADYAKSHGLWNERLGLPVLDLQTEIEKLVRKG